MDIRKYLVEFIGTFFLVFTIGMTGLAPGVPAGFAPLAIGAALCVMVYAGGHISGAHYNPAVTLAALIRGKAAPADILPYILSQVAAAGVAATLVLVFREGAKAPVTIDVMKSLVAEALFTFALVWVVLNVATAKNTAGNSYYGFAIGFVVVAGAYAVGPISGGAFNPAVVVGLGLMGIIRWADAWVHLAGDIAGAVLAAVAFKALARD